METFCSILGRYSALSPCFYSVARHFSVKTWEVLPIISDVFQIISDVFQFLSDKISSLSDKIAPL